MTVSTTQNRIVYTGDGVTTVFPFPYKFIQSTDLIVYVNGILKSSGFTVGTPTDTGANVTFITAPAAALPIILISNPAQVQSTSLPSTGPFPAKAVETALDKVTLLVQRLGDLVGRSLRLSDSDTSTANLILPTPAPNKLLGWNSDATGFQNLDATSLATIVAYGTANSDIFTGTGAQTNFTLSNNPGALNNLDIAIGGVTQLPGVDYSWLGGTSLTFTTAPANGVKILVRYMQGLPSGAGFAQDISYTPGISGASQTTVERKLRLHIDVTDAGIIADGTTDQSSALITLFNVTLGANWAGFITIPFGVKFSMTAVGPYIPRRAVVNDESSNNSWNTAGTSGTGGYLAKVIGPVEGYDSTAATDLTWRISSGHNASLGLDNRGEGASTSSSNGIGAINWFRGLLTKGQAGLRQLGRIEFGATGDGRWGFVVRRHVPWAAQRWEYFYASTAYALNDYVIGDNSFVYKVTTAGTTGASSPVHASGSVVNGTVTFLFVSSQTDMVAFSVTENASIGVNTYPLSGIICHLKGNVDNGASSIMLLEASGGVAKVAGIRFFPTDAGGIQFTTVPRIEASYDLGLRVYGSDSVYTGVFFTNARGMELQTYGRTEAISPDLSTTPSVGGCGLLRLQNSGVTTITNFTGGTTTQEIMLFFSNTNTTLTHGVNIFLKGAVNVTPPANGFMVIKKYSGSTAWFEISRSW